MKLKRKRRATIKTIQMTTDKTIHQKPRPHCRDRDIECRVSRSCKRTKTSPQICRASRITHHSTVLLSLKERPGQKDRHMNCWALRFYNHISISIHKRNKKKKKTPTIAENAAWIVGSPVTSCNTTTSRDCYTCPDNFEPSKVSCTTLFSILLHPFLNIVMFCHFHFLRRCLISAITCYETLHLRSSHFLLPSAPSRVLCIAYFFLCTNSVLDRGLGPLNQFYFYLPLFWINCKRICRVRVATATGKTTVTT